MVLGVVVLEILRSIDWEQILCLASVLLLIIMYREMTPKILYCHQDTVVILTILRRHRRIWIMSLNISSKVILFYIVTM